MHVSILSLCSFAGRMLSGMYFRQFQKDLPIPRRHVLNPLGAIWEICPVDKISRVCSPGVSSDILHKKYGLQRLWLTVASAVIFCLAQIFALAVENPNWLWLVSSLSGLGYGVLFGVFPTIVRRVSLCLRSAALAGESPSWPCQILSIKGEGN